MKHFFFHILLFTAFISWLPCSTIGPSQTSLSYRVWLNGFYKTPTPKKFVRAFRFFSNEGSLDEPELSSVFLGFASGMFHRFPHKAKRWIYQFADLPQHSQKTILQAMWKSEHPEKRSIISSYLITYPNSQLYQWCKSLYESTEFKLSRFLPESGEDLDFLWGYFFATGSIDAIKPMLKALELNQKPLSIAVQWSIISNALTHEHLIPLLFEIAKRNPDHKKNVQSIIQEIIRHKAQMGDGLQIDMGTH
jgi:hypothetical protein